MNNVFVSVSFFTLLRKISLTWRMTPVSTGDEYSRAATSFKVMTDIMTYNIYHDFNSLFRIIRPQENLGFHVIMICCKWYRLIWIYSSSTRLPVRWPALWSALTRLASATRWSSPCIQQQKCWSRPFWFVGNTFVHVWIENGLRKSVEALQRFCYISLLPGSK